MQDPYSVLGISADDCFSHQAFRQKFGLKVILLADVDKVACVFRMPWPRDWR